MAVFRPRPSSEPSGFSAFWYSEAWTQIPCLRAASAAKRNVGPVNRSSAMSEGRGRVAPPRAVSFSGSVSAG